MNNFNACFSLLSLLLDSTGDAFDMRVKTKIHLRTINHWNYHFYSKRSVEVDLEV